MLFDKNVRERVCFFDKNVRERVCLERVFCKRWAVVLANFVRERVSFVCKRKGKGSEAMLAHLHTKIG